MYARRLGEGEGEAGPGEGGPLENSSIKILSSFFFPYLYRSIHTYEHVVCTLPTLLGLLTGTSANRNGLTNNLVGSPSRDALVKSKKKLKKFSDGLL